MSANGKRGLVKHCSSWKRFVSAEQSLRFESAEIGAERETQRLTTEDWEHVEAGGPGLAEQGVEGESAEIRAERETQRLTTEDRDTSRPVAPD